MTKQAVSEHCTRYAMNVPFTYRHVAGRGHRRKHGWTRDLHLRGAWAELPERVRAGSTLEITLATAVGNLSLLAHVAWARPDLPTSPYLHGLCFTGVTAQKREQLHTLIAHKAALPARVACELVATCQRKGVGFPPVPGTIQDLSDRGVCVALPEPVAPGTQLAIRTATRLGPMVADAQVVWADQARAGLPRGTSYRHGLRFLRVDPLSELPLRALLYGIR